VSSRPSKRCRIRLAEAWRKSRWQGSATAQLPVIPIIGARKLSQLQDNLASFDLALSAEQVKVLDEVSQIDLGFPYHFYAKSTSARLRTAACETRS